MISNTENTDSIPSANVTLCKYCFSVIKSHKIFCNRLCYLNWLRSSPQNNSFYGKHHKEESKEGSRKHHKENYNGIGNPFYGKHHSEETKEKLKLALTGYLVGERNPFYGEHHSEETKEIIKEKNKQYREKYIKEIAQKQLERLLLNKEKLQDIFEDYRDSNISLIALGEKYNVDYRVLKKYLILIGICSSEELRQLTLYKKTCKSISYPEDVLYDFLCIKFGKDNIKRQYTIDTYKYDFIIGDKLLIEYDGFYWHNFYKTNDQIKDNLAVQHQLILYRIKEDEQRKVNFVEEIQNIERIYNAL